MKKPLLPGIVLGLLFSGAVLAAVVSVDLPSFNPASQDNAGAIVPVKFEGDFVNPDEFNRITGALRGIFNDAGNIGVGITDPDVKLDVAGVIQSNNVNVCLEDGTHCPQISGPPGPTGPQGPAGARGPAGPQGPAGAGSSGLSCTTRSKVLYSQHIGSETPQAVCDAHQEECIGYAMDAYSSQNSKASIFCDVTYATQGFHCQHNSCPKHVKVRCCK